MRLSAVGLPARRPLAAYLLALAGWSALLLAGPTSAVGLDEVKFIPEGVLPRERELKVSRVYFTGNDALDDDDLLPHLWIRRRPWSVWGTPAPFDRARLEDDLVRLVNVYQRAGYYEARVVSVSFAIRPRTEMVDVTFRVDEGRPVRVASKSRIVYPGAATAEVAALERANPLKVGDVFAVERFDAARRALRLDLRNRGYYAAEVTPEAWVRPPEYAADTTFTVFAGPRVRFGPTRLAERGGVAANLIRRELNWREGDWYNQSLVESSIQDLYQLNLFRSVRVQPAYPAGATDPMPMVVRAAGAPWQRLRLGAGYGSEDRFRAQARYNHFNLFGGGRRFDVVLRLSLLTRQAEATVSQPYVFSKHNVLALTAAYRWQVVESAFSYERFTLGPRLTRRFGRIWTGSLGYQLAYNRAFDVQGGIPLANRSSADPGILSSAIGMLERNGVDSLLFPRRGNAARLTVTHAGLALGGRFDFYKVALESEQYVYPIRHTIFVLRGRGAVAEPYGGSRVPLYERLFSGGSNSVRGYRLDRLGPAIGGQTLVEGSFEIRRRIYGTLWASGFADMGMVGLAPYSWEPNQVRWGAGPGLLATTLVGLVRADVGIPLQPRVGEPNWRFHLSIGQSF